MPGTTDSPPILVITGPTASGKSAAALHCAEVLGAEIISADSRQVYRQIDIGTAKPSMAERERVPHHGIDICALDETYTAGQFFLDADGWIRSILDRGKPVIVAGGTGLYIRVLTEGMFDGPEADPVLRAELERRLREEGRDVLLEELRKLDPDTAREIDADNPVLLVRALEVCMLTGRPWSLLRRERQRRLPYRFFTAALQWERPMLYERINRRVDSMFEAGLLREMRTLLDGGADPSWNSLNTVGYKELASYFTASCTLEAATELIKRNTRRFAKRQLTWFRKDVGMHWIDVGPDSTSESMAATILTAYRHTAG